MGLNRKKTKSSSIKSQYAPEIQAAIDYGIDISLLEHNLKLTCTERILQHQIALNTVEKLRKAKIL